MVQSVSNQAYPPISKLGATDDGRSLYQLSTPDNKNTMVVSVAQKDCDAFEKSYNKIMQTAPEVDRYMKEHSTPEEMKLIQKKAKWTVGIAGCIGSLIPIILTSKMKTWQQILITIPGTIIGLIAGRAIVGKFQTPKSLQEFTIATQSLSKLDVKPLDVNA